MSGRAERIDESVEGLAGGQEVVVAVDDRGRKRHWVWRLLQGCHVVGGGLHANRRLALACGKRT
eukprot:scaffold36963_cov63-Phaeocystis_antarctica.AAC.1